MDHHGIADVDSHMANARSIVCPDEKHEVARLRVGNRGGNVVKPCAPSLPVLHTPLFVSTQLTKPEQSKEVDGLLPPHT